MDWESGGEATAQTKRPSFQLNQRWIGRVYILDLRGQCIGPWALQAKDTIHTLLIRNHPEHILFNLRFLEQVDSLGVDALMQNVPEGTDCACLSGSHSVMEQLTQAAGTDRVSVLGTEWDVVERFGRYFVEDVPGILREERRHPRLKTALYARFYYADPRGSAVECNAIVTDLSEGGLLLEYLDIEYAGLKKVHFDPYQLKSVILEIHFAPDRMVRTQGKVVRSIRSGDQLGLGIEYSNPVEELRIEIRKFLRS